MAGFYCHVLPERSRFGLNELLGGTMPPTRVGCQYRKKLSRRPGACARTQDTCRNARSEATPYPLTTRKPNTSRSRRPDA